jgi:YHS domain-containing protein
MKSLFTVFILTFASAGLAAAADKCPISGKPADSTITSKDKNGKTVAFCCEKCKAKFDAKK